MRPVEPGRGHCRLAAAVILIASACVPSNAATPVPLAPCLIGAIHLASKMPLATLQGAIGRAFPGAEWTSGKAGGLFGSVVVSAGGERLMTIAYLARTPGRQVDHIDLVSPRFQLAPGVMPGMSLTSRTALGAVRVEMNPTDGVEYIAAPAIGGTLSAWEQAGCPVQLRAAVGSTVGAYAPGATDTERRRPGARLGRLELDL